MGRLLIYLVLLLLLAGLGGAIYAVFAELPPPTEDVEVVLPDARLE